MKCFKCGSRCVTDYIYEGTYGDRVTAVRKVCTVCDWKSYPTKIPGSIK